MAVAELEPRVGRSGPVQEGTNGRRTCGGVRQKGGLRHRTPLRRQERAGRVAAGSAQRREERTEHLRQISILSFQSLSEVHSHWVPLRNQQR